MVPDRLKITSKNIILYGSIFFNLNRRQFKRNCLNRTEGGKEEFDIFLLWLEHISHKKQP